MPTGFFSPAPDDGFVRIVKRHRSWKAGARGCGRQGGGHRAKNCTECRRAYHGRFYGVEKNLLHRRKYSSDKKLEWRYGITRKEYNRLLEEQNGRCALCTRPPSRTRLHVDHNHKTGRVRSLLCTRCNYLIGIIEQALPLAPDLLDSVHAYLHRDGVL